MTREEAIRELNAKPVGYVARTHLGNKLRKRKDGWWHILTDPEYGPLQSKDFAAGWIPEVSPDVV